MKKKILVVDNHKLILEFIKGLLEGEGHEVVTAEDGVSALKVLTSFIPDIMFIDLIMPNIGGEKLCRILRNMPNLNGCYLVIISATLAEQELDYAKIGADAFLTKGSYSKMGEHVLAIVNEAEPFLRGIKEKPVLGLDDVVARQMTKELLSQSRHLEIVLESMSEGILEVYSEKIVYANSAAVSLLGLNQEKLLGSHLPDLFDESVGKRMEVLLKPVTNKPVEIGPDMPVGINGKLLAMKKLQVKEETLRNIILIFDISEAKRAEEEKERLQAQLQQIQKMKAIGTLAGGIAHDFNNLLMGIQGHAALLLLDIDSGHPHHEKLQAIEKMVQSGSNLTGQLLGYARKGRYEVKPIVLNHLVVESSDTFGRTRKEIAIHRELSKDLYAIEADQVQMEQVLLNLYFNAADAMPGGGDLILKTMNITDEDMKGKLYAPKPGKYVQLNITDTGMGMDENTMERIFDPFFTTKEMGRGTGLGLASVYGIIKAHGGYIDVDSRIGKGTTFSIYLAASGKEVAREEKVHDEILKGKETVLLIDDEGMIIDVGEQMLKTIGYKVILAGSGKEAIELFKENQDKIDMVILDMIMPGVSGGETYDRIKEINPRVKVLLSSGYSIDGQAEEILERGCNSFIQKPYNIKELSHKLREILDIRAKGNNIDCPF